MYLNSYDNKKSDILEQSLKPPFIHKIYKTNDQSKNVFIDKLDTDNNFNEMKTSQKEIKNSNPSQFFVLNKKEFTQFLQDQRYYFGKKYSTLTNALFTGEDAEIVLSKCKLEEIRNGNKNTDCEHDENHSSEESLKKSNPLLYNLDNEDIEDNSDNLITETNDDNLNNDKKEENEDKSDSLDSLNNEDNSNIETNDDNDKKEDNEDNSKGDD